MRTGHRWTERGGCGTEENGDSRDSRWERGSWRAITGEPNTRKGKGASQRQDDGTNDGRPAPGADPVISTKNRDDGFRVDLGYFGHFRGTKFVGGGSQLEKCLRELDDWITAGQVSAVGLHRYLVFALELSFRDI